MSRSHIPEPVTSVMDAAGAWLPAGLARVEERLAEMAGGYGAALAGDARATLAAGGKRMRPMLVLLIAGSEGGERAIRGAVAIELVHMATLVHDDVLDRAPLRRGEPTVFALSGRERATAVGDLLLSRAFGQLDERRQVALLASASVSLARGELAQRRDEFDLTVGAERYLERCRLKTAALFECACLVGRPQDAPASEPSADPASAPAPDRDPASAPVDGSRENAALRSYGREIGVAFQLLDDVLDVSGPPERTGKARGTDLLDGTVTLPFILAAERDPSLLEVDLRSLDAGGAEGLCDRIAATGALEDVRADARRRVDEAKRIALGAPIDPERRDLLRVVADGVVERYS